MSKLSAFLHPVQVSLEKEIVISDRFQDENGNPVPFKIRSITQEENENLLKKARRVQKVNGQLQEHTDNTAYSRAMVVAATVEPDFSSKEMCEAYGVLDPNLVPVKMLLTGEYTKLLQAIVELSGLGDDFAAEEAKN